MAAAPEMLGQAPAMQDVFRAIGRLSQSNVTVMITGESGSGKELVARALHKHSPRASGPFVAINTAAIPKDLLESELFGHERGAFTGAQTMRRGRFEQAEGGTLFLDEIGDMPFDLQTRLLRVLSDGHFYRVGGHNAVKANVRVIAATHQDLEQRVKEGAFREDLFHRLNVIRLRLPALRERLEDIPMLARHFLQQSAKQLGVEPKRISDAALAQAHRCVRLPGQRAAAGKHLPLAHRDGAGAAHRSQGPAARSGGCGSGKPCRSRPSRSFGRPAQQASAR
jgi:two-component system nitrogen regulation response regulator GlnG